VLTCSVSGGSRASNAGSRASAGKACRIAAIEVTVLVVLGSGVAVSAVADVTKTSAGGATADILGYASNSS